MTYTAILTIDNDLQIDLFEIDVKKSEVEEIHDAFFCEMRFNDFNIYL